MSEKTAILLIYTGGTIGMVQDPVTKALKPFDFNAIWETIPSLKNFDLKLDAHSLDEIIDSSDMNPQYWVKIAEIIEEKYEQYDGFVVLHGTDTMSFTAAALSFMLEGLSKPVILTGSQLPVGVLRSDGKANIITSIEIAAAKEQGDPIVPEVCICFESTLYRGNRTTKFSAEQFDAFMSGNCPPLAEVGIHIKYNENAILRANPAKAFRVHKNLDSRIGILKLFPGISKEVVRACLESSELKGCIIETYGSGNAPTEQWLTAMIEEAHKRGIIFLNITQCKIGSVEMGKYQASVALQEAGVVSGGDMTTEAAIAKMMWVLGMDIPREEREDLLLASICGERSN